MQKMVNNFNKKMDFNESLTFKMRNKIVYFYFIGHIADL